MAVTIPMSDLMVVSANTTTTISPRLVKSADIEETEVEIETGTATAIVIGSKKERGTVAVIEIEIETGNGTMTDITGDVMGTKAVKAILAQESLGAIAVDMTTNTQCIHESQLDYGIHLYAAKQSYLARGEPGVNRDVGLRVIRGVRDLQWTLDQGFVLFVLELLLKNSLKVMYTLPKCPESNKV
mmetsp:Transcript_13613/g.28753  ORF Transcript_13613/g.28753 Transcript_13613/m.28753 type:complete len:185 (-) Transcript_13613:26-580(-)